MVLLKISVAKNYLNLQEEAARYRTKKYDDYWHDNYNDNKIHRSRKINFEGITLTGLFVKVLQYSHNPQSYIFSAKLKNLTDLYLASLIPR
jgi:hypothetical protein